MIDAIAFPFRVILYLFENPTSRMVLAFIAILAVIAAIWPGALYVYPVWNATVTQETYRPFSFGEKTIETRVLGPNKILPGKEYDLLIELENNITFSTSEDIEIRIWEDDPNVIIADGLVYPIVYNRKIPINTLQTINIPISFEMAEIERPYSKVLFNIRIISTDGDFTSGVPIPIDFFSIPIVALATVVFAAIYGLLRVIAAALLGL